MKLGANKQEQQLIVVTGLIAVVVLWVYVAFALRPLMAATGTLGKEIVAAKMQLQHTEQALAQEPAVRHEHDTLNQRLAHLKTSLPGEEGLPAVIERLTDLATQSGIKIRTIFPQRTFDAGQAPKNEEANRQKLYKEIPIQIDALAGYHQVGAFLARVEGGDQPMELKTLRITSDPKEYRRHNMKIVIKAYFSITPTAPGTAGGS